MKFVLIFGPQAVGKMTVGQELAKLTGFKLFHNHMTIEMVTPIFDFGGEAGRRLVKSFRMQIFEEAAKSDMSGLIFTMVWAFDVQKDWDYVDTICDIFESQGNEVYFVELEADLGTRIERNRTPNRLEHKPTKRDVEKWEKDVVDCTEKYRLNSNAGEIKRENYIRLDNTELSAEETARIIRDRFKFEKDDRPEPEFISAVG